MKVRVELFASLRLRRFARAEYELPAGATVAEALAAAGLGAEEASILFLNSRRALPLHPLGDGDILAVFPPIGGG